MKRKKLVFYNEAAYVAAVILCSLGASLIERASLGIAELTAPAYVIYLKLHPVLPFYTFGMSVYLFQGVLLILMTLILRNFKLTHLLSFLTAFICGNVIDLFMRFTAYLPQDRMALRILYMVVGVVIGSAGGTFFFQTYITQEVYDIIVKEIAHRSGLTIGKVKWLYDVFSVAVAVILAFAFFGVGRFDGLGFGTIFCALTGGFIVDFWRGVWSRHLEFKDGLPWREFFEKQERKITGES